MHYRFWKYATTIVVILILLNPEAAGLALVVNAIGLDMFLILLGTQVLAVSNILPRYRFRSFFSRVGHFCMNPGALVLAVPGQATLMHLLVFTAATDMAVRAF
jgi:hypothetical protein